MLFIQFLVDNPIKQKQRIRSFWFAILVLFSMAPVIVCANPFNEKNITVTIIKNDTLVSICKKYLEQPNGWKTIARINGLVNPHLIFPGETLRIPSVLLKGIPIDGMVTFLKGRAMFQPPGGTDWTQLHMGDPVSQGTQLKTFMDSAVEITFEDGASFFLRPETTISLETARKKDPSCFIRKLFMPAGRTLLNIKKSTGTESRIEIRTPSAVSAARGTQFRVSADDDEVTRTEVLGGIVGVEAMGRDVRLDRGEGTWVKKGEVPRAPIALLPPPSLVTLKALYQVLPSQFTLTPVDNATSYRVMLSTDSVSKNVVAMAKVGISRAVFLENLEDGIYYCQALSIDGVGLEGLPSQPKAFEIRVNPLPPFIQKPLDGQEFRQGSVSLEWLSVTDAVAYEIQVAKDPGFKDLFMDVDGISETRKKIYLDDFADYYFRVRSIARDQFKGVWSDTIGFVFLEPPKAPPVDTPQMDESKVNIRWQNLGPEIFYHFQMATDPLFKEIIRDSITKESYIVFERPEKSGVYHVRISAIDSQGYEGQFTSPQNFQIKGSPYWKIGAVVSWAVIALIIVF
ncbi:LysM1 [Desulforapulum autotrophicum HRM2]|uniref:LysM1 n=1 Tax=Desulforapulum autotrophicum (strain ATCC 43914 / DSM 3382 / VKM B-1955 / HRM2) TaxID=177437 RepID=C0Q8R9_DESAH|nr:FecR domain-containing protein [Desulforapulum autotrophicum]ACN14409.1 LysM1 [Desulforapulum autotrophicum HRM2]